MSDDVLITPASRKIEFKDNSGNVDGKIELDANGNLNITSPGGDIGLGDPTADIFIGDGTNNVDIVFEQNGEIRGLTGRTLTLGQSDSDVAIASQNFTTTADLHLNNANIVFEGSSADNAETTITVVNPTMDRTITIPNASGTLALDTTVLPLSGGVVTGTLTNRVANDVVLSVHSDTTTTPTAAVALMRGTTDTYGADAYVDWKLENGYGSGGSNGGTLSLLRTVDGTSDTYYMDLYRESGHPSRHFINMLQDVEFQKGIREKAYNLTGTALDPSNGTLQYKTLSSNTTFTEDFEDGDSIILMIDDGSSRTVTWPTMTWAGGNPPVLATSGYTTVVLWHRGGLYGAIVT